MVNLLALASLYEAPAFHDGDLELVAFRWDKSSGNLAACRPGVRQRTEQLRAKKLATGEWMMSRRASDRSVSMLIGGVKSIDDWQVVPFSAYRLPGWWRPRSRTGGCSPMERSSGLFRDNSKSGRLLRSFSTDNGRSWTPVVRTNFPDATSKFHGLQTSRGYWVMASNANPQGRHPLCLSISHDGLVFTQMFRLPIPETLAGIDWAHKSRPGEHESVQYPHVLEHQGAIHVAYSRKKQTVEIVRVMLPTIDAALAR